MYPYSKVSILDAVEGFGELYISDLFSPHTLALEYSIEDKNLVKENAEKAYKIANREDFNLNFVDEVFVLIRQKSLEISEPKILIPDVIGQVTNAFEVMHIREIETVHIL